MLFSRVLSQHHHPLAYSMLVVFPRVLGQLVCGVLGRSVCLTEGAAFLSDMVCTLAGTGHKSACYRLQTIRLSPGVSGPRI